MAAFKVRLTLLQGETYRKTLTWKVGKPALPVDLTGCSARMQVRSTVDSPVVLLALSTDDGRIVLGGPAGTVQLLLSATETAALAWRQAVYDIEIEWPDGTVRRLAQGAIVVSPEVTRGA